MEKTYNYRVLLYYHYTNIEDPETLAAVHLDICKHLNLKGRVLIAEEGINGTVSGTIEETNWYMETMENDPLFEGITFKVDSHDGHAFKKMHVRSRPELVTLRLDQEHDPREVGGEHLDPQDFYQAMHDEDTVILDARNDYEYDLGHFRGAIRPDINTFRELPEWVRENRHLIEGKRILTYCTGGIRCEKFTGWLIKEGFEDVAQLNGGIVSYGKDPDVQGELWDGRCYVFDERISVPINQKEHVVVGRDHFDGTPCERYINCADPDCNKQILASEANEHKYMRSCSHKCRISPRNLYVKEHNLTVDDIDERLRLIEEDDHIELSEV